MQALYSSYITSSKYWQDTVWNTSAECLTHTIDYLKHTAEYVTKTVSSLTGHDWEIVFTDKQPEVTTELTTIPPKRARIT